MEPGNEPPGEGVASLSLTSRIVIAIALGVVTVATIFHLGMVFLHVAPPNTLSNRHDELVDDYVLPEFEQNWKLFAPDPLQSNIAVHARAQVRHDDGSREITGWVNLSAMDGENIHRNPFPSHTAQNELRRAWSFFTDSHDSENRAIGPRGELSERYVRRIVMLRLGPELNGGVVEKIQVRSTTDRVAPPRWSGETADTKTRYRVVPWWVVSTDDLQEDDRKRMEARGK